MNLNLKSQVEWGFSGINFLPIMNDNKSALRQNASKKGSIDPRLTTPHFAAISEQKNVRRSNKRLILSKNAIFGEAGSLFDGTSRALGPYQGPTNMRARYQIESRSTDTTLMLQAARSELIMSLQPSPSPRKSQWRSPLCLVRYCASRVPEILLKRVNSIQTVTESTPESTGIKFKLLS